jgi:prepilin-type N-terminal cleavage/methylation domain-containing protein
MKTRRNLPAPADHRRRALDANPLPAPRHAAGRRADRARHARRTHGQGGFSMVETLIAAALIGIVAVGIIPMFTRAMTDNITGADYTRVTNYAKSKEEDFARLPILQPTIQLPNGQTQLLTTEYMNPTTLHWDPTAPANPLAVWTRTTTITQYNMYNTDANNMFDNPLPGGSAVDAVHVTQAQVQVKSVSAIGPLGGRRSTTIRYLKAF